MYLLLLLSNGGNGADDSAKAGRYLWRRCIDPINDLSYVRVRGGVSSSIGSVFRTKGVIPVDVILWPSHSHSRCANLHFDSFRLQSIARWNSAGIVVKP